MTAEQAIRFAVESLPAIHQNPDDYHLRSTREYADLTVYTFGRKRLAPGVSDVRVTVRDNRLPNGSPSASYEVL